MKFDLFFTQFKKSLKISFTRKKIGICLYTKSKSTQKLKFSQVLKFVRSVKICKKGAESAEIKIFRSVEKM